MVARYEPRRNFKRDDSPGGTDLSARLSFAKRAREVKAANEAVVFKEDYPRDDKSIEDDERPNRSRVSEPSGTYRKSISDAEKSGKETDERPGYARDTGDARTSRVANEKLRKLNENRNEEIVNETDCSSASVFAPKIKRKRISRGVQCDSIGHRSHVGRSFLNRFKLKLKRHSLKRKAKRKKASANKFDVEPRIEVNILPGATIISDESHNEMKEKVNNTSTKKDEFEKMNEKKIERITYGNDNGSFVQTQNIHDNEKPKDDLKYRKVKINLLDKLRLGRALMHKHDSEAQQNELGHESRNHKEKIVKLNCENKKANCARKREDNSQGVKIDCEMDSGNRWKTIKTANKESDINKIKERLDSCIAELNGIIGDVRAIFDNKKEAVKNF
ncbi:hypothetical protein ALC56_12662 [Trachymyrmex septentrionalis]|uniref:Uncharacterized protein n=2 Tax=Trachymyrmex septentrionalis TaxID=34720 RepID=A0A195EXS3_9HYME|nr:hypothetical protein ALC56_12662 [Trachymyrmex septentrionalis]